MIKTRFSYLFLFTIILFTSCGVFNNHSFTKQKYTHYKTDKTQIEAYSSEKLNTKNRQLSKTDYLQNHLSLTSIIKQWHKPAFNVISENIRKKQPLNKNAVPFKEVAKIQPNNIIAFLPDYYNGGDEDYARPEYNTRALSLFTKIIFILFTILLPFTFQIYLLPLIVYYIETNSRRFKWSLYLTIGVIIFSLSTLFMVIFAMGGLISAIIPAILFLLTLISLLGLIGITLYSIYKAPLKRKKEQ